MKRFNIMGIDPGLGRTGYGVVDSKCQMVACGCIYTPSTSALPERLIMLYNELSGVIAQHNPVAVGVEELFFNRSRSTAIPVAHARGAILMAVNQRKLYQYSPSHVKRMIAEDGHAGKAKVAAAAVRALGLTETPQPDDASDALAIALVTYRDYIEELLP